MKNLSIENLLTKASILFLSLIMILYLTSIGNVLYDWNESQVGIVMGLCIGLIIAIIMILPIWIGKIFINQKENKKQ